MTLNRASGGFTSAWNGSQFTITAIPEPSAMAVAALLAACGWWIRVKKSAPKG